MVSFFSLLLFSPLFFLWQVSGVAQEKEEMRKRDAELNGASARDSKGEQSVGGTVLKCVPRQQVCVLELLIWSATEAEYPRDNHQ